MTLEGDRDSIATDVSVPNAGNRRSWLTRFHPAATPEAERDRKARLRTDALRFTQVLLGLLSMAFAVVVLAQPLLSLSGLLVLLAEAVGLVAAQTMVAGGRLLTGTEAELHPLRSVGKLTRSWGTVAIGGVAVLLAAVAVFDPALAITVAVFLLAIALVVQGFARIFKAGGVTLPRWIRGWSLGTGVFIVLTVALCVAWNGLAIAGFAILVGVVLMATGIETVVVGLHPTDPRQFVLLRLLLFSAFYGLILINWIDLYGKQVPAYGIWLILTYMAPFGVLIVFQGWRSWPLAVSLGLLVSLFNDVGYYFIGNLIFGFHQNLGPWIAGQLGFRGDAVVTFFEGGNFSIAVTSWMMGLSIYARAAVVGVVLYYWWGHPSEIVAATRQPSPASPG